MIVEYIPKEIWKFIGNKSITTNIYTIQAYDSIMCGYFGIGLIDFMLNNKKLIDFTNLFSPNSFKKMIKEYLNIFINVKLKICSTAPCYSWNVKPDLSGSCVGRLQA